MMYMFMRNMRILFLVMGVPCLLIFVYAKFIQRPRQDPLAFVRSGDPDMAAARAQGHDTLPLFLEHLRSPAPDETHFVVKLRLEPRHAFAGATNGNFAPAGDEPDEFIWANQLSLVPDGTALTGSIDDTPRSKGFFRGQPLVIPLDDVVDWGYMKGAVMQGNYTTKALLAKMPAADAARAKQVLGWQ